MHRSMVRWILNLLIPVNPVTNPMGVRLYTLCSVSSRSGQGYHCRELLKKAKRSSIHLFSLREKPIQKEVYTMKNFNLPYLLILVLLAISFTGCNDDFLTRTPLDEISDETFWETENDLRVFNNSLYHMTLNEFDVPILMGHPSGSGAQAWRGSLWFQDGFSDNLAPHHDRHTYFQQVRAGKHNIPTSAQDFGYRGWNFVRSANVGLENYD